MATTEHNVDAGGDVFDPRTSFRVDTVPRSIPSALRDYVGKIRSGDPGALPSVLGLIVLGTIFTLTTPKFLTKINLGNLPSQASFIALIAMGLVFVLLLGEIDLSAGTTGGVCAGFAAQALSSQHLKSAVGAGVFFALVIFMAIMTALAVWQKMWWATAIVGLGLIVTLTGLEQHHVVLAFFFALAIGVSIGVFNGTLVAILGIPSFIVTLALFLAWQGVTLYAVKSQSITTGNYPLWFGLTHNNMAPWAGWLFLILLAGGYTVFTFARAQMRARNGLSHDDISLVLARAGALWLFGGLLVYMFNQNRSTIKAVSIEGIPWAATVPIIFMVVWTLRLSKTTWGRHLYAIGGNREAATRAGIPVSRVRIGAFAMCSGMAAVGGLFLADYSGGALPSGGQGNTLLFAVAAAVIGGTSLFGGRGKPRDAVIGALVIATIPNGIQLHASLGDKAIEVITGAVLLIAASVDAITRRQSSMR
jgi:D-xylose transport system permease protein